MKNLLVQVEHIFVIIALLFCSGGVLNLILSDGINEGEAVAVEPDLFVSRMVFFGIATVAAFLVAPYWKGLLYLFAKEKWMLLILLMALLSFIWSDKPDLTLRRSLGFIATMVFGCYFGTRFSLRQQVQLLAWSFACAMGLSLLFVVLLPKYGIAGGVHEGAWRGIYFTKNVMGKSMFLSAAAFWALATNAPASDRGNRLWLWAGLLCSVGMIVLSNSASAMVNLILFVGMMTVIQNFRFKAESAVVALSLFLAIASILSIVITLNLEAIFQLFGRDPTLTGRSELWPSVLLMIKQRFWLGYGYSGFWDGLDSESAFVWKATKWTPPNSHNGLLDVWLDLGLIGVIVIVKGYWNTLLESFGAMRSRRGFDSTWMVAYLIFLVLANLTESSLLGSNSIFWILYMGVCMAAVRLKQASSLSSGYPLPGRKTAFKQTTPIFFNRNGGELDEFYQRWSEDSPEQFPTWRLWDRPGKRRD